MLVRVEWTFPFEKYMCKEGVVLEVRFESCHVNQKNYESKEHFYFRFNTLKGVFMLKNTNSQHKEWAFTLELLTEGLVPFLGLF